MEKDINKDRTDWPKTLDEAAECLLEKLSKKDKKAFQETNEDELIMLHMGIVR